MTVIPVHRVVRRWFGTALVLLASVVLLGSSPRAATSSPAREAAIRAAMFHCPYVCTLCAHYDDYTSAGSSNGNLQQPIAGCEFGFCTGDACDLGEFSPRDRAEAIVVASAGSPDEIAALLERFPDNVHINMERGAVQITGCSGAIIAHVPLSAELVTAIAAQQL